MLYVANVFFVVAFGKEPSFCHAKTIIVVDLVISSNSRCLQTETASGLLVSIRFQIG
jgi:hypothetical protein